MKKTISLTLLFFFLTCFIPFPAYAEVFNHKAVFENFEGYSYDKFDKKWTVVTGVTYGDSVSSFSLIIQSEGVNGGDNLNGTIMGVSLESKDKKQAVDINSIDILIGEDVYSYKKLIKNGTFGCAIIGENGNLLIESLATCDPSNVAVRIKNSAGNSASLDLDARQVERQLKRFCAIYVLNHVWDYVSQSESVAQLESSTPLFINGKLADYGSMHKDIDYDEINHFLTELSETESINDKNETAVSNSSPKENTMYVVGSVGNSYIELTSWKLQNDHDGKPAIVLTYTWTNNSNETAKASLAVSIEAYQNGVSLDNAFFIDGVDTSSGIKNVRPGYSIEVQTAFRLSDTTADVELEFKDMWDIFGSSTPINTTIHLS